MRKEPDYEVTEGNVFEALGREQSEELLARANLLQQEVAKRLEVSQSKVSMLVSGKLSAFSADSLMHYLFLLGCEVEIRIKKPRSKIGIFRHKGCIAVC